MSLRTLPSIRCGSRLLALPVLAVAATLAHAEVINIDNGEFQRLLREGLTVVDLRTAPEWKQTGVVDRSHLITLFDERGRADPEAWLAAVDRVAGAGKPVVLICRTGNRTRAVARYIDQLSPQRKVYNVTEGITGWMRAGKPVVSQQQNVQHAGISCGPVC